MIVILLSFINSQIDTRKSSGNVMKEIFKPGEMKYFTTMAEMDCTEVNVLVESASVLTGLTIQIKCSTEPTLLDYDEYQRCVDKSCLLATNIYDQGEVIIIGIHNSHSKAIEANVIVTLQNRCPNNCFGHGRCIMGTCVCESGYVGKDCSLFVKSIPNGLKSNTTGTVDEGQMKYYKLSVRQYSSITFSVKAVKNGVVDMYVQHDDLPIFNKYTKSVLGVKKEAEIMVSRLDPTSFVWYIGIHGASGTAEFNVSGGHVLYCPRNCSNNGVCESGACLCNEGWAGEDCNSPLIEIPTNLQIAGKTEFESWNYYTFEISASEAMEINLQEYGSPTSGTVWMYLAKARMPTLDDYDYRNQSNSYHHSIFIPSSISKGTWVIGTTGSMSSPKRVEGRFKYRLILVTGCGTYTSCNTCTLDPSCGWCRVNPSYDSAGQCLPGTATGSLNQTCIFYQYSSCEIDKDAGFKLSSNFIIGLASGIGALIAGSVIIFLVYREYRKLQKAKLRPVPLVDEIEDEQNDDESSEVQHEEEPEEEQEQGQDYVEEPEEVEEFIEPEEVETLPIVKKLNPIIIKAEEYVHGHSFNSLSEDIADENVALEISADPEDRDDIYTDSEFADDLGSTDSEEDMSRIYSSY